MPKVMLVEDDNNLREIYDARLVAEGYEIVSAHDGEEALALAVKERPDLIISDVMMPKISGFDMLDILRTTPETKNTKVIMMTALGQAEDRARAEKLGADRYLVKSQVTLEDVIKVAHEVLGDAAPTPAAEPTPTAAPVDVPVVAAPPVASPVPATPPPSEPVLVEPPAGLTAAGAAAQPVTPPVPAPAPQPATVTAPAPTPPPAAPLETPTPSAPPIPEPAEPTPPTVATPVPAVPVAAAAPAANPAAEPIDASLTKTEADETSGVEQQIQDFISSNPALSGSTGAGAQPPAAEPTPPTPDNKPTDFSAPPTSAAQDALSNPSAEPPKDESSGSSSNMEAPSHKKLVLQPTENALAPSVDLNALLEKENLKDTSDEPAVTPASNTVITPAVKTDTTNPNDIAL